MDANGSTEDRVHRPGAVSAFFVYKAALFAAGFWAWLAVLVFRGLAVSGWHILAATGAITTTLVAVILGARFAMDRAAADRHVTLMKAIVDLSWYSFSPATAGSHAAPSGPQESSNGNQADVIRLPQEARPRQRR